MKKNLLMPIFAVIFLSILLFSCGNDNPATTPDTTNSIKFDFSGFITGKFESSINKTTFQTAKDTIIIQSGTADDKFEIKFKFVNLPAGASEIDISTGEGFKNTSVLFYKIKDITTNSTDTYPMVGGKVHISENSSKAIKGTFDINTGDSFDLGYVKITNGSFYINK